MVPIQKLLPALLCFVLGGIGCLVVLGASGGEPGLLFGGMVASLTLWGTAFFLFLRWRDRYAPPHTPRWSIFYQAAQVAKRGFEATAGSLSAGGVHALKPGASYRVIKSFTDCYNGRFEAGTELTFIKSNFVPYHGGTVLHCTPRSVYLQDEENSNFLGHVEDYLEQLPPAPTAGHQPPPLPPRG